MVVTVKEAVSHYEAEESVWFVFFTRNHPTATAELECLSLRPPRANSQLERYEIPGTAFSFVPLGEGKTRS